MAATIKSNKTVHASSSSAIPKALAINVASLVLAAFGGFLSVRPLGEGGSGSAATFTSAAVLVVVFASSVTFAITTGLMYVASRRVPCEAYRRGWAKFYSDACSLFLAALALQFAARLFPEIEGRYSDIVIGVILLWLAGLSRRRRF